jgi:hypothetical protein
VNSESLDLKEQKAKMARSKLVALLRAELKTKRSQKKTEVLKSFKEEGYAPVTKKER